MLCQHQVRFVLLSLRSPLLAQSLLISFPAGTKMFQFSAWRLRAIRRESQACHLHGCPIRQCPVLWLHAPRRTFSQLARTFVATQAKQFPKWHGSQLPSVLYLWPLHRINMKAVIFVKLLPYNLPGASPVRCNLTGCIQIDETGIIRFAPAKTKLNRSRRLRNEAQHAIFSFLFTETCCIPGSATNQSRLWTALLFPLNRQLLKLPETASFGAIWLFLQIFKQMDRARFSRFLLIFSFYGVVFLFSEKKKPFWTRSLYLAGVAIRQLIYRPNG